MSVRSVSPPVDGGHSYAWWSGRFAAIVSTLLRDPHDEVHRARARRLLADFDMECRHREELIGVTPQSLRAEFEEFVARPQRFFPPMTRGRSGR